ncbi:hypothetical protein LEN26_016896 [Aphanomyces euteiches]|nr:hypothetical protein LEN26_016896 [Aphanomyces euteiches]KAH9104472.1 hypothetical protein AeMF1_019448 [Aphanomyces euteiches]KAH9189230.1 hypothetical protein AeNC1_008792 [Aphanomyces euteiches]
MEPMTHDELVDLEVCIPNLKLLQAETATKQVPSPSSQREDEYATKWGLLVLALQIYRQLEGHIEVPFLFVIPRRTQMWPLALWQLKLGEFVRMCQVRHAKLAGWKQEQLTQLGFTWHKPSGRPLRSSKSAPSALLCAMWKQDQLDALDFQWHGLKTNIRFETKLMALQAFHDAYGHLRVPPTYQLPSEKVKWDGEPIALGEIVVKLRQSSKRTLSLDRMLQLNKLGFVWSPTHDKAQHLRATSA